MSAASASIDEAAHARLNVVMGLEASTVMTMDGPFEPGRRIVTTTRIGDADWTFDLHPASVRANDYGVWHATADGTLRPVAPGPINTLRGSVRGRPDVRVTGSVLAGGLVVSIRFDDDRTLWLEPIGDRIDGATAQDYVLYDETAVRPGPGVCGVNEATRVRRFAASAPVEPEDPEAGPPAALGGITLYAELGCDADFAYFQTWGGGTEDRVNALVNAVNEQYTDEVGIAHVISGLIIRTEPVYSSNAAGTLLQQFRNRWLSAHGNVPRDAAFLFTGRDLNGSTLGIAFDTGAVCTTNAYCLAQVDYAGDTGFACATNLAAHELGHLWGADHCDCFANTMNPGPVICSNTFHPTFTQPEIIAFRNTRPCLEMNPPEQLGACCFAGGACAISNAVDCGDAGGVYLGDGVGCTDCPGGCCFPDGSCQDLMRAVCLAQGGTFEGVGATCAIVNCPQPLTGGCCFPDGNCAIVQDFSCEGAGGFFLGSGSDCVGVSCPTPMGACCLADETCIETDATTCAIVSGSFLGDGSTCAGGCAPSCFGDLNENGAVDFADLVDLLSAWGPCPGCPPDFDGNGAVDFADLVDLLSAWGACP